jgi:hypothetical protein
LGVGNQVTAVTRLCSVLVAALLVATAGGASGAAGDSGSRLHERSQRRRGIYVMRRDGTGFRD